VRQVTSTIIFGRTQCTHDNYRSPARTAATRLLTLEGMPALERSEVASLSGAFLQSTELDDIRCGHIISVLLY
jgi:hypothetical protein